MYSRALVFCGLRELLILLSDDFDIVLLIRSSNHLFITQYIYMYTRIESHSYLYVHKRS